jgi:hypothetical protein
MSPRTLLAVSTLSCAVAVPAAAVDISYLHRGRDSDTAVLVDSDRRTREIRKGESLQGLGRLEEIGDGEIVFERALDDVERKRLQTLGLAAPEVERLHLQRHEGTRAAASSGEGATVFSGD